MAVATEERRVSRPPSPPARIETKKKAREKTNPGRRELKTSSRDAFRVGALSGCAASFSVQTCMFPLNTVKTRLQARAPEVSLKTLRRTLFRGLYSGFFVDTLGSVPGTGVFMATYEALKSAGVVPPAVAATVAGVAGSFLVAPADAIKQRLQVDASKSLRGELKLIAKSKSPIKTLFVGYPQFLARDLPFDTVQVTTFELLKRWHKNVVEPERANRTPRELAMLGAAAGAFTGMVTTPLDVARTAEVCAVAAGIECRGASCLAALVSRGGPGVLLRGAAPRMLEISLGGAIYFSALEAAKRALGWEEGAETDLETEETKKKPR
jgi:solute carrier family 25 S-adenosylmethionine transporter 26